MKLSQNHPQAAAPDQADKERYRAIVAEAEHYLTGLARPLQESARPLFEQMIRGEFSRVAALLPAWLADLLPLEANIIHRLGLAQLYFWWYYHIQDELIDHAAQPVALLSGHLVLLKAVETYHELGLTRAPCWLDFQRLTQRCAEATAVELQTRFSHLDELTPARLVPFTIDFLTERVAAFYFTTTAQLHLAGVAPDAPLYQDVLAALRCFAAARQIGDDASDWSADLKAGQLNYVSARLMRRLYDRDLAATGQDLDPERLAGYQLRDETFWAEIEQTAQALSRQALDRLAPYGGGRLARLIRDQMQKHETMWAAGRTHRSRWRETFGLEVV